MTSYRPDSNSAVTRASVAALPVTSVSRTDLRRIEDVRDAFALEFGAGEIAPWGSRSTARRARVARAVPRRIARARGPRLRSAATGRQSSAGNQPRRFSASHGMRLLAASCTTETAWPRVASSAAASDGCNVSAPSFVPSVFTRAAVSESLWNSRVSRSSACAANSWLCEKIAADVPPVSSDARQVSRGRVARFRRDDQMRGARHAARRGGDRRS